MRLLTYPKKENGNRSPASFNRCLYMTMLAKKNHDFTRGTTFIHWVIIREGFSTKETRAIYKRALVFLKD